MDGLTGIVNTHTMVAMLILQHGNEEQKRRWLPLMASGESRGALSLSESDAGATLVTLPAEHSAMAMSMCSMAQRLGLRMVKDQHSSRWLRARLTAYLPLSSRRNPAPNLRESRSARRSTNLGIEVLRPLKCPTLTIVFRRPT